MEIAGFDKCTGRCIVVIFMHAKIKKIHIFQNFDAFLHLNTFKNNEFHHKVQLRELNAYSHGN